MSYLNNVSQQALLQLMMPNTSATATTGAQKNDRLSTATVGTVASQEDDDNVDALPDWEEDGWVPTMTNGKQKTPNRIRGELQRYIDESSETQTAIINRMRVNGNTFRRFMNSKTYKDQWSAVQNGTYGRRRDCWSKSACRKRTSRPPAKSARPTTTITRLVPPVDGDLQNCPRNSSSSKPSWKCSTSALFRESTKGSSAIRARKSSKRCFQRTGTFLGQKCKCHYLTLTIVFYSRTALHADQGLSSARRSHQGGFFASCPRWYQQQQLEPFLGWQGPRPVCQCVVQAGVGLF